MEILAVILATILLYVVPAAVAYHYDRKNYTEILNEDFVGIVDILFLFIPIGNIGTMLAAIHFYYAKRNSFVASFRLPCKKPRGFARKFFRI